MARTTGSTAPETRSRILDAAIALFRERGFAGSSIRELAERAGMTTAAMYYHFQGKDQILEALFDPCLEGLRAIDAPPGDGQALELLEQVVDLFADQGASIQAVMNDQSAMKYIRVNSDFLSVMAGVTRMLAASDDRADLIRAQAAMGALQRGLIATAMPPAPGSRPATGDAPPAAGLDPADRAVIVAAALGALRSEPSAP
jgi:AcrR family transcriptional regulator